MPSRTHGISGFARSEWLFFFSAVLVLMSIAVPAFFSWQDFRRTRRAYTDLRVLIEATRQYHKEYGSWPASATGSKKDQRFGLKVPNRTVMQILMAGGGPDGTGGAANPRRIEFIAMKAVDGKAPGLDANGDAVDPWGSPYQMVFDSNYSGSCDLPDSVYGEISGEEIVAWSAGRDRILDTGDDLKSWLR